MSNQLLRAKIADANRRLAEKNLLAEQYTMELREMLDPSIMDYTTLPMLTYRETSKALDCLWVEMCELKKQIQKMETALNG
ncbi:MAG: hypothetical protein M0R70_12680 [Nitrospirae bacterium]|nr:hypothetical protein [Nitrospirota bacterium]